MNKPGDLLLRWLSEEGAGELSEAKQGLWWFGAKFCPDITPGSPGRWLRDAVSLAYLDVDWHDRRWSAAPPVVTPLPAGRGLAVLTGSRTAAFDQRLDELVKDELITLFRVSADRPGHDIPLPVSLLLQFSEDNELSAAAEDLGALHAPCFARQGAALLGDGVLGEQTSAPEFGAPLERYDFGHGRYLPAQRPQSDGLYRLKQRDSKRVCQVLQDGAWFRTSHEHGVYAVLASQGTDDDPITWRPGKGNGGSRSGTLFVDWGYPLPDLHRRVATMCSGLAPRINVNARNLAYDNVPEDIAAKIAQSLGQSLGDMQ
ncbi:hypothetical protein [Streptomyces sp. NPDC056144]|uniref:hypothetical protein n=1 Tax=unclassified Streptomyces TaxID=2593676 RepID=UPI0035E0C8AD